MTKIEWTDATWNPITGCTKVSDGCKHCYAERVWKRLAGNPHCEYFKRPFTDVQCHPVRLGQPLRWKKPRMIFVNSMSDLFHESIPFEYIASVFAIMGVTTRHTYQVLTKRPERMLEFFEWIDDCGGIFPGDEIWEYWPEHVKWKGYDNCGPGYPFENVWLGVSVEDQKTANERIPLLLQTPAAVRWLSIEPMLGAIDLRIPLNLMWLVTTPFSARTGYVGKSTSGWRPSYRIDDPDETPIPPDINWVVVGGESGPKARPMHPDWVRSVRDQCQAAGVPFFFKQHGEWIASAFCADDQADVKCQEAYIRRDGYVHNGDNGVDFFGSDEQVLRLGKKKAGRTLDGRTWEEYPDA